MDQIIDRFIELALQVHAIEFSLEVKNCRVYNEVNTIPIPSIKNSSALKLEKTSKMIELVSSEISGLNEACDHERLLIQEYQTTLNNLHIDELNLTRELYLLKTEHLKDLALIGESITHSYGPLLEPYLTLHEVLYTHNGTIKHPEHATSIMNNFLK